MRSPQKFESRRRRTERSPADLLGEPTATSTALFVGQDQAVFQSTSSRIAVTERGSHVTNTSTRAELFHNLDAKPQAHQPDLFGYLVLPGETSKIADASALVTTWCKRLQTIWNCSIARKLQSKGCFPTLRRRLLRGDFDNHHNRAPGPTATARYAIGSLPNSLLLRLCRMMNSLISRATTSCWILQEGKLQSVSCCFVASEDVPFAIEPNAPMANLPRTFEQEVRQRVSTALLALHVTKQGQVGVCVNVYSLVRQCFHTGPDARNGRCSNYPSLLWNCPSRISTTF